MCKLFCITSHDPAKRNEIIQRVWTKMAITEKDGYGACWFGVDGQIGYLKRRLPKISTADVASFVKPGVGYAAKPAVVFDESNDIPSDGGFLVIHGRAATGGHGGISLENTHPFIQEYNDDSRVAMIHNGKVESKKYDNQLPGCTCDSELLMQAYVHGGIDEVELNIEGLYAMMMLEWAVPTEEELAANPGAPFKKLLHIAKDSKKYLYAGAMPDDTPVIATSQDLITEMGAAIDGEVYDNRVIIFTDRTNYTESTFKPLFGFEKGWAKVTGKTPTVSEPKTTHSYPANGPGQEQTVVGSAKDIEDQLKLAEQEEIEALERAPITV